WVGDRHVPFVAAVPSAVAARVSVPTSGFVAAVLAGASGVPVAGGGSQPVAEPSSFVAGVFARVAGAPVSVVAVFFAFPVAVSAPTPPRERFAAADPSGLHSYCKRGLRLDYVETVSDSVVWRRVEGGLH